MFSRLLPLLILIAGVDGFSVVFMAKRGKGGLKRRLNDSVDGRKKNNSSSDAKSANQGRGQEITGVTLPAEGKVQGWEFGEGVRLACANVRGTYYAVQVSGIEMNEQ